MKSTIGAMIIAVFPALAMLLPEMARAEMAGCQSGDPYADPDSVITACTTAIVTGGLLTSQNNSALLRRAEAYYWARRYAPALIDLDLALKMDPQSVEALLRRGWTNFALHRLDESIRDLSDALSMAPQNADVLFALGFVLWQNGAAKDVVLSAFTQALEAKPDHYLAKGNLAELYFYDLHDADRGIAELDGIIAAKESDVAKTRFNDVSGVRSDFDYYAFARWRRTMMLMMLKRYNLARQDAEWLVQHRPHNAVGFAARAELRRNDRDYAGALADADAALAIDPRQVDAQITKLQAFSYLGRNEEMFDFATLVINSPSADYARGNAYYFRGRAEKSKGNRDAAIADIEQSFSRAPFYLQLMLQRMKARGYYDGEETDAYSRSARLGLEACMLDPEC